MDNRPIGGSASCGSDAAHIRPLNRGLEGLEEVLRILDEGVLVPVDTCILERSSTAVYEQRKNSDLAQRGP